MTAEQPGEVQDQKAAGDNLHAEHENGPVVRPASVLILTPVKNAARYVDSYFAALAKLTYPAEQISLGLLESDSDDDSFARFAARLACLPPPYASARIWHKDFGYRIPPELPRWTHAIQLPRRKVL